MGQRPLRFALTRIVYAAELQHTAAHFVLIIHTTFALCNLVPGGWLVDLRIYQKNDDLFLDFMIYFLKL